MFPYPSRETDKTKLATCIAAGAHPEAAAVAEDRAALVFQQVEFASAQSAVGKLRLRQTGRLDVSAPSANAGGWHRFRRVASRVTGGRHNLDGARCQDNGSQGIGGKVGVDTEGKQAVGCDRTTAAFSHLLIRLEHIDHGAIGFRNLER